MPTAKILLVNDDQASLLALQGLLAEAAEQCEYLLLTARSGMETLRQVLRHDFAVILLDVGMPGMDGFETAEAIHAHPRSRGVPIIFIGAHSADELKRLRAYRSGAVDYLLTPVVPQVLQAKVAVFVELRKKNIELQAQLARLNQDLQVQRLHDLERINRELESEVTGRKLTEQRAYELSIRDPLTGLLNRRSLIQKLEQALAAAARSQSGCALLFLDLDRFKHVNDTLGHDAGDELLRQVAARLSAAVRASDVVARLGGDEFVVLVEGRTAAANAARVARKIGAAQAHPYLIERHRIHIPASIGISIYPRDGDSARTLMKSADLAMYHARRGQRDLQLQHGDAQRARWRGELEAALAGAQFELLYQPLLDVASGAVTGVEALLHWRHPQRGLLAAPEWQDCVPDCGLRERIDQWCIEAACAQAVLWRDAALPGAAPGIAVNLLAAALQPALAQRLIALLERHRLAPASIGLELPEALLSADAGLAALLGRLRAAGVTLSVDDFGAAGAPLAACRALPLDALKLHRGFMAQAAHGGEALLAALLALAHALALGTDDAAQLAQLKRLGCGQCQGALSGAPLAAAALMDRLRHWGGQG